MLLNKFWNKLNYSIWAKWLPNRLQSKWCMIDSETLLYACIANKPFFEGYSWAKELARRLNLTLNVFLCSSKAGVEKTNVYHALLEAQGHYLQHYGHAQPGKHPKLSITITGENPDEALMNHLDQNRVDIIVVDHSFTSSSGMLKNLIDKTGGAILLEKSDRLPKLSETDRFSYHFLRAQVYKLSRLKISQHLTTPKTFP